MTSVLPPWKLELIEKKKKRLEEEKAKEKQKEDRYSNLPEWKRSILFKRKGGQGLGDDLTANNDDKPNNLNTDSLQNDCIYGQNSIEEQQRRSHGENTSSRTRESLQNGNEVKQHSFVANSHSLSADKQREDSDIAMALSNSAEESSVSYEHIRTPSELRKLYELQVAGKKANKTQENKESSGSLVDDTPNTTQIRERSSQKPESRNSKSNGRISKDGNDTEIISTQNKMAFSREDSVEAPVVNEINQQDSSEKDIHEDKSEKELQNGQEVSEVHVESIRNIFGPSGCFRRRSVSTDNLLKSNSEQSPSNSPKPRPSPINKRWSMVSLSRTSSTDDEIAPSPKPEPGSLQRARSMSDMRVDHPHEPIHLRHRASVSMDIEHRIHELLHHVSPSDDYTDDECVNDDSIFNEMKSQQSQTTQETHEKPVRERTASWSTSEDGDSTINSFHITNSDEKAQSLSKKSIGDQKSNAKLIEEIKEPTNKMPAWTLDHHTKQDEIAIEKQDTQFEHSELSEKQQTLLSDSENGASFDDLTSTGPSVHKLSALFGSSILKGNKKTKDNKSDKKNESTKEKAKSKDNSKSRKFPWNKKHNDDKKDNTIDHSTEKTKFPFEGSQGLKPIHKKYVEHKITGNMTLVVGANTDNTYSKNYNHLKAPANYPKGSSPATNQSKITSESTKKKPITNIDYDDECITIIDVPDTSSHDIEVSAIDIPESPTPVSVIDMPGTQDSGVKVSLIDVPQDTDSDDSDDGTTGSYEVNPGVASSIFMVDSDNSESVDGEEDEDEDDTDDNLPVSYIVVFEKEREIVKSCLSSPLRKRKRKGKVIFHSEQLINIHDYPSEQCLQSHFDEMEREKGGLGKYQPSALKNINLSVESLKPREPTQATDENLNQVKNADATQVTYSDDGEGFSSSSSSSGAMLF